MTVNVTDTSQPLNSLNSLRDGFLVFAVLGVISLANVGLHWEIQNISKSYGRLRISQILQLDKPQIDRIRAIDGACQIELIKLKSQHPSLQYKTVSQLLRERDRRILEVLDGRQQQMMYRHCTDLVTFTKMLSEDSMKEK